MRFFFEEALKVGDRVTYCRWYLDEHPSVLNVDVAGARRGVIVRFSESGIAGRPLAHIDWGDIWILIGQDCVCTLVQHELAVTS